MTVFDFSDFREFIKYRVSRELYNSTGRKKSTLARVARGLGYSSPSLLSMVLTGKRIPSDDLCEAMIRNWNLQLKEREYFRLLIQLERRRKQGQDASETIEQIRRVAGNRTIHVFKEQEFSMIKEWHFVVIQHLAELPTFREDPVWISKALRRKVTPTQAQQALEKMQELGVLERDPETGRLRPAARNSETSHDVPSSVIRLNQRQMIYRALEAHEDRPIEERQFNGLTFCVERRRMPELRKQLLEFMRMINAQYSADPSLAEAVCQLNLQFFEHTLMTQLIPEGESHEIH